MLYWFSFFFFFFSFEYGRGCQRVWVLGRLSPVGMARDVLWLMAGMCEA